MVAVATIYDPQNPSGVAQRERISSNAITMESHCRVVNIKNNTTKHNMSPYCFSSWKKQQSNFSWYGDVNAMFLTKISTAAYNLAKSCVHVSSPENSK